LKSLPLLALLAVAAPAWCQTPCSVPQAQVAAGVDASMAAFARMDAATVLSSQRGTVATLTCVDSVLTPDIAARIHFIDGVSAFFDKDLARTRQALRAALELDPTLELPEAMRVEGHPLYEALRASRLDQTPGGVAVVAPPGTAVFVNGRADAVLRPDRPAIIQVVSTTTKQPQVLWTGDLDPSATVPNWATALRPVVPDAEELPEPPPVALPPVVLPPPPLPSASRGALPWYAAALASSAASGLSYATSQRHANTFAQLDLTRDEVLASYDKANHWAYAAQATGALAVGFAGTGVVLHVSELTRRRRDAESR